MMAALGVVFVGHAADSLSLQGRQGHQTAAWASLQQRRSAPISIMSKSFIYQLIRSIYFCGRNLCIFKTKSNS
jgi:hypothetical protein